MPHRMRSLRRAGFRIRRAVVRNRRFPSWFFGTGCLVSRQLLSQRRRELRPSVRFFRLRRRRAANVARAKCRRGGRCRRFGRARCPESSTRMRSPLFCPARRALPAAAGPVTRRGRFVRDSKRICLGVPKNLPLPAFRGSGTTVPCPVVVVRRCKKRRSVIYIR